MTEVQPNVNEQIAAIRAQMAGTQEQLSALEERRAQLTRQLDAGDASRSGRSQLESVLGQISSERARLAALENQLSRAGAPVSPDVIIPVGHDEHIFGYTTSEFMGMSGLLLLTPLVLAVAWRIVRRPRGQAPLRSALNDERLTRLEQAMDAVAVEIERIGEAQRFQTKLMSEGRQPELRKAPAPVITPH